MKSELAEEISGLIEARLDPRPTPMEFEMAYQGRIAIDRIRSAIKHSEQFGPHTDQMRDAGLQLLDALHRLEAVDRRFQTRSRVTFGNDGGHRDNTREISGESKIDSFHQSNARDGRQMCRPEALTKGKQYVVRGEWDGSGASGGLRYDV